MSLYRKYRPSNFSQIVGQDAIRDTLLNAVKSGKVNHAYLFTGPRGTGKTSAARILAKTVNCTDPKDFSPCEKCEICTEIKEGRLIDLIEIDAASNRGIDEIRDLKEKINFAPSRAKNKIYIIDEVHMLTKEAFNALLKTLEEPPEHVYFILATTEVHKIPETILSRCQRFDFKRIAEDVIVSHLKFIAKEEGVSAEENALKLIAYNADGGMRDAIGLFEKLVVDGKLTESHVCEVLSISGYSSIEKLYGFLENKDTISGLKEIQGLYSDGFDLINFNKNFLEYLRKKMIESVESGDTRRTAWILKVIENFQESYAKVKYSTIAQLPLEIAVVKSCLSEASLETAPASAPPAAKRFHKSISAPTPTQTKKSSSKGALIDENEFRQKWDEVLEKISVPASKRAFSQSKLLEIEEHNVVLEFSTQFYLGKMMETANKVALEKAVEDIFGVSVKIVTRLNENAPAEAAPHKDEVPQKAEAPASSGAEDKVLEIFGGELA